MFTKPSVTETVVGHPVVRAGVAATAPILAALNPLAVLLPVLTDSLAGELQQRRANQSLQIIAKTLQEHKDVLDRLSEAQFHLMTEVVSTTFTTVNEKKLEYLQSAVKNTLRMSDVASLEAALLGRIVRDISSEEAEFFIRNYRFEKICTAVIKQPDSTLVIPPNTYESLLVLGLERLGVLEHDNFVMDGGQLLRFSKIANALRDLLCAC